MNKDILNKIYHANYRQKMEQEEYQRCVDTGFELLDNAARHVTYQSERFKNMLLAIEYNNELPYDLLKAKS